MLVAWRGKVEVTALIYYTCGEKEWEDSIITPKFLLGTIR